MGIFCILDEACRYPRNTDNSFLQKLVATHTRQRKGVPQVVEKDKTKEDLTFTVKNWYGDTTYDVTGFLEKNKGVLGPHIISVVSGTKLPMLSSWFPERGSKDGPGDVPTAGKKGHTTYAKTMTDSLSSLFCQITSTSLSVIRCINPNSNKKPGEVDYGAFVRQVERQDVLASVRMRQEGFCFKSR